MLRLSLITAVATSLIALGFFLLPRKLALARDYRHLKNHLNELARAWTLLAVFYIIRVPMLLAMPTNSSALSGATAFVLGWHTFALLICAFTNLYLLRSIFDLEEGFIPVLRGSSSLPLQQRKLSLPFESITSHAILGSLVLSLLILYISSVTLDGDIRGFVVLSYAPQLLLSMALFIRLGGSYSEHLQSSALALATYTYAILQLAYLLFYLHLGHNFYELVLTMAKVLFASMVAWTISKRVGNLRFADRGKSREPLQRLGNKLARRARIQESLQAGVLLALGMLFILVVVVLARLFFHWLLRSQLATEWVLLGFFSTLILLLGALQFTAYWIVRKGRYMVRWQAHAEGALSGLVERYDQGSPFTGWSRIKLTGGVAPDGGKDPKPVEQVRVVLLHGLFSDGPRCWGLLPAIFLDSGRAREINLLSYSHGLFTSRRRVVQLGDELAEVLRGLLPESAIPMVIYAHSLGGLLLLTFVRRLVRERDPEVERRLQHICFVGSPFAGSWYAYLCFPWAWSRLLGIGSNHVRDAVGRAFKAASRPGLVVGEEQTPCTFSYIRGIRDRVVGGFVSLVDFPGQRFDTPVAHSIPRIFSKDDGRMWSFMAPLNTLPRSVLAMRQVGGYLIGRREPLLESVFLFEPRQSLETAYHCCDVGLRWGDVVPLSSEASGVDPKRPISALLEETFLRIGGTRDSWEKRWAELRERFKKSYELREVIPQLWPAGHQLLLAANRYAGVAVVTSTAAGEAEHRDSVSEIQTEVPAIQRIGQILTESWRLLDQGMVSAIFAERCTHRAELTESSTQTESVIFNAAFDKNGNYLGIYERTGIVVSPKGVDGVLIHTAGAGPQIDFSSLRIVAFDLLTRETLTVEWMDPGAYCHLWRMNFRSPKKQGDRFAVRWFFQWEHCMSTLGDLDAMDLSIYRPSPRLASLRLQTPTEPAIISVGIVSNNEVTRGEPSDQFIDRLRGQFQFGIAIPGQDDITALLVYYRLKPRDQLLSFAQMVQVQQATDLDLEEVVLLEKQLEGKAAAALSELKRRRKRHSEGFVVAKLAGRVVGYVESIRWDVDEVNSIEQVRSKAVESGKDRTNWFIVYLGVIETARGRGIGTKLLETVQSCATASGAKRLQLVAFPEMVDFYKRRGFTQKSEIPNFFEGREAFQLEMVL